MRSERRVIVCIQRRNFEIGGKRVFAKLAQWMEENGYEIVGPAVTICYNDPHTTPEEELVSECQFPVRKRR